MFAHNVNEALELIKKENDYNENLIEILREDYRKLRDEYDKDEEIQKIKAEVKRMRSDYYRGFPISEEEDKQIKEWQKKHDAEVHGLNTLNDRMKAGGCIGGRYQFLFTPTSIGTVGECICQCGARFKFQDL